MLAGLEKGNFKGLMRVIVNPLIVWISLSLSLSHINCVSNLISGIHIACLKEINNLNHTDLLKSSFNCLYVMTKVYQTAESVPRADALIEIILACVQTVDFKIKT